MGKLDKVEKFVKKGKVDKLIALSRDSDAEVRHAAINGLSQIGGEDSFNALIHMLDDPDTQIRITVLRALGHSASSYADTHLRYCLTHEKDENVLQAVREALSELSKTIK